MFAMNSHKIDLGYFCFLERVYVCFLIHDKLQDEMSH